MEDYAIILDYLPLGHVAENNSSYKNKPIAQAIGTEDFTLLELAPKPNADIDIHDKVYIGSEKRDKIARVNRRIRNEDLTATSRVELQYVIEEIIQENEPKFLEFINNAGPISTRFHQLELVPGIGKKYMLEILKVREEKPFESFEDLSTRIPAIKDPVKLLTKRVLIELDAEKTTRGKKKYSLFTKPATPRGNKQNRRNKTRKN